MSKITEAPSAADVERARAHVESAKNSPTLHQWVREQAVHEIKSERVPALTEGFSSRFRPPRKPSADELAEIKRSAFAVSVPPVEIEERIESDFWGLVERVCERQTTVFAVNFQREREAAEASARAKIRRNTCPVCGEYSSEGHRPRNLMEGPRNGQGDLDSCLPCFLTAQQEWMAVLDEKSPRRRSAVREAVSALIDAGRA